MREGKYTQLRSRMSTSLVGRAVVCLELLFLIRWLVFVSWFLCFVAPFLLIIKKKKRKVNPHWLEEYSTKKLELQNSSGGCKFKCTMKKCMRSGIQLILGVLFFGYLQNLIFIFDVKVCPKSRLI